MNQRDNPPGDFDRGAIDRDILRMAAELLERDDARAMTVRGTIATHYKLMEREAGAMRIVIPLRGATR
jgi:hypothetical protein